MSVFAFEARELSCSPELKPGCRRKNWRVKGKNSFGLCFPFVNLVSTRHEKDVKVGSAENDIGQPLVLWFGNRGELTKKCKIGSSSPNSLNSAYSVKGSLWKNESCGSLKSRTGPDLTAAARCIGLV